MRYHNSGKDEWAYPRQRRHKDFGGHGRIDSLHDSDYAALTWPVALTFVAISMAATLVWM